MADRPAIAEDSLLRAGLLALGLYQLALGLFMILAPGTFFTEVGPFGPRNDHYIRDNATWELALAAAALVAVARLSWRVPVLAIAAVHYALHAVNHLVDVGEATPAWVGVADLVLLALGAGLLAVLWRRARNQETMAATAAGEERR
jgi:hypothetical protein